VPIRVGEDLIAFLQTGQILLHRPSRREFSRLARQLVKWGVDTDLKQVEEAYFQTRVLTKAQYDFHPSSPGYFRAASGGA